MVIRKRSLSEGWFPGTETEIKKQFAHWDASDEKIPDRNAVCGVVPHAGWFFSGNIAYLVMKRIDPVFDTIVLLGGHLAPGHEIVGYDEDGFETPSGILRSDTELASTLRQSMKCVTDRTTDNSVEVLYPMIRLLFPEKTVAPFRLPASEKAIEFAETLMNVSEKLGRKIRVIGSTDLTHYGPVYHFTPHGTGKIAEDWARNENDAEIIRKILVMDTDGIISHSWDSHSACSGGAAAAAALCALRWGSSGGEILRYSSSLSTHQSDSFVGYAGIVFPGRER